MDWFKNEASLRDPLASHFVMAPFIREMFKKYHELTEGEVAVKNAQMKAEKALKMSMSAI
jgi:hypothetical protein